MKAVTGLKIEGYWQDEKKTKRPDVSKRNVHRFSE
jgi:hypothetical protein